MNINTVTLTGNLTRTPESFADGKLTKFGLAVNEREKQGDEWVERASFFDVICFGRTGENVRQYLDTGSPVAVAGRLRQDRWEKDGEPRSKVVVVAERVQFLRGGDGPAERSEQLGTEEMSTAEAREAAEAAKSNGHQAGSLEATADNIKAHCICRPGAVDDNCPIEKHGVPFARPRIPDLDVRRRDLFVGDVLPPGEGVA